MKVFAEPLDPSETKDFAFDWSPQLSAGETVSAQVVTFIDAAGTTSPSNSVATPISRVWLTGGTHGARVIFIIRVTTSGGKTLEESFGVNVVDSVLGPVAETDVERLTREITECKAQRVKVATGGGVVMLWRDGRRVSYQIASTDNLNNLIRVLEGELAAAQAAAGIVPATPRRRAIGLLWV